MGKIMFVIGILGIVFTILYDKVVKGEEIIFGPKSCSALVLGVILVIAGLTLWKKR